MEHHLEIIRTRTKSACQGFAKDFQTNCDERERVLNRNVSDKCFAEGLVFQLV